MARTVPACQRLAGAQGEAQGADTSLGRTRPLLHALRRFHAEDDPCRITHNYCDHRNIHAPRRGIRPRPRS